LISILSVLVFLFVIGQAFTTEEVDALQVVFVADKLDYFYLFRYYAVVSPLDEAELDVMLFRLNAYDLDAFLLADERPEIIRDF